MNGKATNGLIPQTFIMRTDRQGEKLRDGNVTRMQNEALYKTFVDGRPSWLSERFRTLEGTVRPGPGEAESHI